MKDVSLYFTQKTAKQMLRMMNCRARLTTEDDDETQ